MCQPTVCIVLGCIPSYKVHLSPATTSRMNYPQASVQLLSVMELALGGCAALRPALLGIYAALYIMS
jgi:hypothetical protein